MSDTSLLFPIEPYKVNGYTFGERVRSRIILWARHLGDDVVAKAGTRVVAIGDGEVVWSEMRPGSATSHNWGGLVLIKHRDVRDGKDYYSLYGHIKDVTLKVGDMVTRGQLVGLVADGNSPENGWWKLPHLHFGIYAGPWMNRVLPGYKRFFDDRTKFSWWRNPKNFITQYNKAVENRLATK